VHKTAPRRRRPGPSSREPTVDPRSYPEAPAIDPAGQDRSLDQDCMLVKSPRTSDDDERRVRNALDQATEGESLDVRGPRQRGIE